MHSTCLLKTSEWKRILDAKTECSRPSVLGAIDNNLSYQSAEDLSNFKNKNTYLVSFRDYI